MILLTLHYTTLHYALAADSTVWPEPYVENGVTWSVVGTVAEVKGKGRGQRTDPGTTYTERSEEDRLWDSQRIDENGYEWAVSAVDMLAVDAAVVAYDEKWGAKRENGAGEQMVESRQGSESADENIPSFYQPLAWVEEDCDGDGNGDIFRDGIDDRVPHPDPMQDRQRAVVMLWMYNATNGGGQCSGTIVDGNTILTAAHCFREDDNSVIWSAGATKVCTRGNSTTESSTCYQATSIAFNGAYDGSVENDFAVVKLSSGVDLGLTEQVIALSTAADSVLDAATPFAIGYPAFRPACASNTLDADGLTSTPAVMDGFHGQGAVTGTPAGYIKTNLDMGVGQSGGAIWFFPPSASDPELIGVISRNHPYATPIKWNGGPKVRSIRTWVISQF